MTLRKRTKFVSALTVSALTVSALIVSALSIAACDGGREGERCNPSLAHDECNAGLACARPADCPESYCCPTNGASSSPFCRPGCAGGQASICAAGGDADCVDAAAVTGSAPDGAR